MWSECICVFTGNIYQPEVMVSEKQHSSVFSILKWFKYNQLGSPCYTLWLYDIFRANILLLSQLFHLKYLTHIISLLNAK